MQPPLTRPAGPAPAPAPRGRHRTPTLLLLLALVAVLVVSAFGAPRLPASGPSVPAAAGPRSVATTSPELTGANCSALATAWTTLDRARPAPAIAPDLEAPCVLDPDVAGLYFVSDYADSGDRVQYSVTLPANGTDPAGAYAAFWIGMWVTGIGCSYSDAAYLTVELIPPYATDAGVAGVPWWTVEAPVWDLVPAGACDPQCQNDTVTFSIGGQGYCEDDAIESGVGALGASGHGALDPGDALTVTLFGAAGGTSPLAVYLNDTSAPSRSLAWNYSAADTVTGDPIVPLYSVANDSDSGWTGGLDDGFGWYNCPTPDPGTSFATACDSYDRSIAPGASPELTQVASWNATALAYTHLFATLESSSSTGACSGGAGIAPCADFTTYGGSDQYPVFGVGARDGRSWITYGPSAGELAPFAPTATEFPGNGNLSVPYETTVVGGPSYVVGSNFVNVTVRATDPNGVARLAISSWWCTRGTTRFPAGFAARESSAIGNTPEDGNWTAVVGTQGDIGTLYLYAQVSSVDGAILYGPEWNTTLTTGSGGACNGVSSPAAPTFSGSSVTAVGGGFGLVWGENGSWGVRRYDVKAVDVHGGNTTEYVYGNVTSVVIGGLNGTYNLTVTAIDPAGYAASTTVADVATGLPLVIEPVRVRTSSIWAGSVSIGLTDNLTGGHPRYLWTVDLGDGASQQVGTQGGEMSLSYTYPASFDGLAAIRVSVLDSWGDNITAATIYVWVQGPPTGVPATMSGASGFVQIRFGTPLTPTTTSIDRYSIYWTTDPAWAPYLTSAWPSNASAPAIHVGVTGLSPFNIPVPDGTEVWAVIVAWDSYGEGLLPAELALGDSPVLTADASSLTGTLVAASAGGSAPFTDAFNASFSLSPSDALTNATYRFSTGPPVAAAIASAGTSWWANASVTFPSPGLVEVYLYVTDLLGQSTILQTSVYVAAGPTPLVSISASPSTVWANATVTFSASASDGSGSYAFNWSLGDGSTATGASVNYSYAIPGNYLVSVAVRDTIWGGSAVASVPLVVHAVPTVEIAEEATASSSTYRFVAVVYGGLGNLSYTWLFGDGTTGYGASVTHTWPGPGNYTVSLEAVDHYGHTLTASTYAVVSSPPSSGSGGAGGSASLEVLGALVVVVIALAVILAVLALRLRSRPPPEGPAPEEATAPEGEGAQPTEDPAPYR
jgi:hypothetical protein